MLKRYMKDLYNKAVWFFVYRKARNFLLNAVSFQGVRGVRKDIAHSQIQNKLGLTKSAAVQVIDRMFDECLLEGKSVDYNTYLHLSEGGNRLRSWRPTNIFK